MRDRPPQRLIHRLRQPRLLHLVVEHQAAERLGRARSARRLLRLRHRPVANRADRLAEHCRTHDLAPLVNCRSRHVAVREQMRNAHDIARWLKRALFADSCVCSQRNMKRRSRMSSACQSRHSSESVQIGTIRSRSGGPVQPSSDQELGEHHRRRAPDFVAADAKRRHDRSRRPSRSRSVDDRPRRAPSASSTATSRMRATSPSAAASAGRASRRRRRSGAAGSR